MFFQNLTFLIAMFFLMLGGVWILEQICFPNRKSGWMSPRVVRKQQTRPWWQRRKAAKARRRQTAAIEFARHSAYPARWQ